MKTMYGRQFATMAGMVLLSFLLLGTAFATLSYQYTINEKKQALGRSAGYIASFTSGYVNTYGSDAWRGAAFQGYLATAAEMADAHILVCTNDGLVLYATGGKEELQALESRTVPSQTVEAIRGGSYAGMSNLGGLYTAPRYLVGLPIQSGDFLQGLVLVSCDAANISVLWKDLSVIFMLTAAAVIIIAAILSSVTSLHLSNPIRQVADAARKFGHGELDVRVDVGRRQDEVGELAEAFNTMADSLAKSEQRRAEFIANVSHELKTPMTTIAGFADGILDGTIPPEEERRYLEIISSETRRLSRLVRSMLDLSRLQSGQELPQQQFDLCETLVRTLVSLESKVTGKDLEVNTDLPDQPLNVWGDQDAITQVCYNLLDNAIKFSRPGGTLGVSVASRGGKAVVSISNEGDTIPPEELSLIFDRFHKTDHSRSVDRDGVGLGLYIVRTILNSHKENITCQSADGVTKFTFTLAKA